MLDYFDPVDGERIDRAYDRASDEHLDDPEWPCSEYAVVMPYGEFQEQLIAIDAELERQAGEHWFPQS